MTNPSPPPVAHAAIADHSPSGKLVLTASQSTSASKLTFDTWTWDGSSWVKYIGVNPPGRTNHSLAYDGTNCVLFGGKNATSHLGDTWTWNGSSWTQVKPTVAPSARTNGNLMYLAGTGAIHFGGQDIATVFPDTWIWNGSNWSKLAVTNGKSPLGRVDASTASNGSYILLVGGASGPNLLNDVWKFTGTTWTQVASGPSARKNLGLAYDTAHGNFVLFGGHDTGGYLGDTWAFDGTTWTQKSPVNRPSNREGMQLTYDSTRGQVTLFGGVNGNGNLNDTWVWTGTNWIQQ